MSSSVSLPPAQTHVSTTWLQLIARIGARLSQDGHALRFIEGAFAELQSPLSLNAYLYYQAEKDQQTLSLLAYQGIDEEIAEQHDRLTVSAVTHDAPCVWPADSRRFLRPAVCLPDLSSSLPFTTGVHLPLCAAGQGLGTLVLAGQRSPFSTDELQLLQTIADLIASALDRSRLRYQLRTEHARFQGLLDHFPAAVLVAEAPSGRIVMGNPEAQRILGRPVSGEGADSEAEAQPAELPLLRALSGDAAHAIDYLYQRSDGKQTWLRASGSPIRDPHGRVIGSLITCYDIDQEKRAEAALRHSEENFRQLADATPNIVWAADAQGRIDYFNRRWFQYTGYSEEKSYQIDGWHSVLHPDDLQPTVEKWSAAVSSGEPLEIENRLFDRSREIYRWHLVRAVPLRDAAGRIIRWLGTATDIDERIRVQQALIKADRSKDEFMAILAHELRNPLAAISYAVSLLELDSDGDETRQPLELIRGQVSHVSRLIEDLLDLSRVKQRKMTIQKRVVDLNEIVRRAVEATRPVFQERQQTLQLAPAEQPLLLQADPTRLEQVVVNLLNNAAKYTESGGRIWLSTQSDAEQACLTLRDNGIGMSKETLARAFDLFTQDSGAKDRSKGGLGIGLALVDALVKLHHGSVTAHSDGPGRGSQFVVRLPLHDLASQGLTAAS